jgi:hypothetical protein
VGLFAPWFLAGAAMVGLPLWLHLLRRHRNNPQPFSSLMFFERRTETSVQPKRLRFLVLLALRMALLLLLALAFANPFVNRTDIYAGKRRLTVIAIDRSFSMRDADHMERARRKAAQLVDSLPGRTQAQIVAVDSRVENLTPMTNDRDVLRKAAGSLEAGDLSSSFAELVRALHNLEQNTGAALEVHLISDLQQTSMPAAFSDLQVGPYTSLSFENVGEASTPNWAVETVSAPDYIYDPKRTRVSATVAGWQTPGAARKVSLVLDGHVLGTKDVTVPPNGRVQTEFTSFNVPYGAHRGEIRIEPHDSLVADDVFPFAVERADPRTVLFLTRGQPRDSFYYKAALDSAENAGLLVQTVNIRQASGEDLSRYPFLILSDPGSLEAGLDRRIAEYVRHGGSLLILVGPESIRAGRLPVTDARLSSVNAPTQNADFVDNAHPALAGLGPLQNVQFYSAVRIAASPDARVLAKLADGSPLLMEQTVGEGRVLTFASTFDNVASDFPLHKSFVPFVAQTGRYLSGADATSASIAAGNPVELRRSRDTGAAVDVIGPDGHHELSLREAASARYFTPQQDGFYEVQRANGQRRLIAVHTDRRESDLAPISSETLALWRNTGNAQPVAAAATSAQQVTHRESLWRFFLILVLGTALSESIFGNRYLRKDGREHDGARTTERIFAKT